MMRIGIDARFAIGDRRGIGTYCLMLIKNLAVLDPHNEYVLYISKDDTTRVLPRADNVSVKRLAPGLYPIWEQLALPFYARADKVDVLHCTGNTAPVIVPSVSRMVVTIHDVSYLQPYSKVPRSPFLYQRLGRWYRSTVVRRLGKVANKILTVSEFAKRDILAQLPGLEDERIAVFRLGVSEVFSPMDRAAARSVIAARFGIRNNFILTVGGRDPQKNTIFVLRNYVALKRKGLVKEGLVIVGVTGKSHKMFGQLVEDAGLVENVTFIEYASQDDLRFLYNVAKVFIFPSLYESFGLPPLEAMACGTPTIVSNGGALAESTGGCALLLDPYDDRGFCDAVVRVLEDSALQQSLSRKGVAYAGRCSWAEMAKRTLQVYEEALASSPS